MINFKLYIDLDGVLTNFDKRFREIPSNEYNLNFIKYEEIHGKNSGWRIVDPEGIKWWSEMEWIDEGKRLWEYFKEHDPCILSSPNRHPNSVSGKFIWCKRELDIVQEQPTISPKKHKWADESRIILSGQKELFCKRHPNSILIDDTPKKINRWIEKGGIGILHINTDDTINQFLDITSKNPVD